MQLGLQQHLYAFLADLVLLCIALRVPSCSSWRRERSAEHSSEMPLSPKRLLPALVSKTTKEEGTDALPRHQQYAVLLVLLGSADRNYLPDVGWRQIRTPYRCTAGY